MEENPAIRNVYEEGEVNRRKIIIMGKTNKEGMTRECEIKRVHEIAGDKAGRGERRWRK